MHLLLFSLLPPAAALNCLSLFPCHTISYAAMLRERGQDMLRAARAASASRAREAKRRAPRICSRRRALLYIYATVYAIKIKIFMPPLMRTPCRCHVCRCRFVITPASHKRRARETLIREPTKYMRARVARHARAPPLRAKCTAPSLCAVGKSMRCALFMPARGTEIKYMRSSARRCT